MKVRRWLAAIAAAFAAGLVLGVPAGASTRPSTPGPPLIVFSVSADGAHDVYVSWTAPASDGGFPILYFVASTYNGRHRCVVPNPGPNSCVLHGLNGNAHHKIYVRAISAAGHGHPAVGDTFVVHPDTAPTSAPVAASPAIVTPAASVPPGSSPASITTADQPVAATATSAQLPFTGANVSTLLTLGCGFVLGGMLLCSSRREWQRIFRWFLGG